MSFPIPKIIYDPGTGAVTLTFTYPPLNKPGTDELTATRHDSDTISGVRQSVFERIDEYRTLEMAFVPQVDEANWSAFMAYALTGGAFDYYADPVGAPTTFEVFTLDDTDWVPKRVCIGFDSFTLKMRKVLVSS